MARPKKRNADYFSHDRDMKDHPKVKAIRKRYGSFKGYALWCFLLERLTGEDDNVVEIHGEIDWEIFAADMEVEPEELRDFLAYCQRLRMITIDPGLDSSPCEIRSPGLDERLSGLYEKREKAAERARRFQERQKKKRDNNALEPKNNEQETHSKRGERGEAAKIEGEPLTILPKNGPNEPGEGGDFAGFGGFESLERRLSRVKNPQSKVKESKVKESKEREKKGAHAGVPKIALDEFGGLSSISTSPRAVSLDSEAPASRERGDNCKSPSEVISQKILTASQSIKDTWRMKFRLDEEDMAKLPTYAEEFADWWVGEKCTGLDDERLQGYVQTTGAAVFQSKFASSWLKNVKKYGKKTDHGAGGDRRSPQAVRDTGRRKSEDEF